jgi:hypothetical protein
MAVIRRCLGCQSTDSTENLLRCVAVAHRVVVDEKVKQPGRGAYAHRNGECLQLSLQRKAWGRALKTSPLDCGALENLSRSTDLAKTRLNG